MCLHSSSLRRGDPGVYAWGGRAARLSFRRAACSPAMCYHVNLVSMQHYRASGYRCSPTREHAAIVARTCGCAREVETGARPLRTEAGSERQERVSAAAPAAALTGRQPQPETAWLNEVAS